MVRLFHVTFTPVFFYWIFSIDVVYSMKGINKLICKGMPNIYVKVQSCKLHNYIIITFAVIGVLVFKLLSHEVLFINRKDNRKC